MDCDQLENLDYLFDIVRTETKSVVVVLTTKLLSRAWCAAQFPAGCDAFNGELLSLL